MTYDLLSFLSARPVCRCRGGAMSSSRWSLTHVTIASVTIFLHRAQAHRGARPAPDRVAFLPLLAVAHHRHGHQGVGRHPPQAPREGGDAPTTRTARRRAASRRCFWQGTELYRDRIARTSETLDKYGHGTPDDWIERNLYARFTLAGRGPDAGRQPHAVRADRR